MIKAYRATTIKLHNWVLITVAKCGQLCMYEALLCTTQFQNNIRFGPALPVHNGTREGM